VYRVARSNTAGRGRGCLLHSVEPPILPRARLVFHSLLVHGEGEFQQYERMDSLGGLAVQSRLWQIFAGGISNLLRTPNGHQVAVHLDTSNSGSYPKPAHLAAVYHLNGTALWTGSLAVSPFDMYQRLQPVDNGRMAIISQFVISNSSQTGAFLFAFANDGTPSMVRRVDPSLLQQSLFYGHFSNYVLPSGNGVQAYSFASGDKTWSASNATLLRNNVTWPNGVSFGFAGQRWSRVALSDTIFLVDYTNTPFSPYAAAFVASSFDLASGHLVWENAMQVSRTSCYVIYGVLPADSTPVVVIGRLWYAYNPKTGAVTAKGSVPGDAACANVLQQWAVMDLDGSSIFLDGSAQTTILGYPGNFHAR
jgi:hypothetical protein